MKKKSSKNYIAFTLTEMTMVLLIMSIIAAVSAPLVKHAVSDVVSSSVAESTGIWRKISSLSGIFYSSVGNGIVSIGTIPGAEPINYGFPAMIIQSNGGDLNDYYAQIGTYANSFSSSEDPGKVALDRYNNIALGSDIIPNSKNPSYGKIEIGHGIGYYLSSDLSSLNKTKTANQAVMMGVGVLDLPYASANHSILIGRSLSGAYYRDNPIQIINSFDDAIVIGSGGSVSSATDGLFYATGSVNIGDSVANANIQNTYNVNIGHNVSWWGDRQNGNVNIGSFTNSSMSTGSVGVDNTGSINIGRYAGSYHPTTDGVGNVTVTGAGNYGNVFVGKFAGSFLSKPYNTSIKNGGDKYARRNNIAIGLNTLATAWQYEQLQGVNRQNTNDLSISVVNNISTSSPISTQVLASDIAIGAFAGNNFMAPFAINGYNNATPYANHNVIFIGAYAGADAYPYDYSAEYNGPYGSPAEGKNALYGTIAVGQFAGYKMGRCRSNNDDGPGIAQTSDNGIMIGYYAGYSNKRPSTIAIGSYAGSTTNYDESFNGMTEHTDSTIFIGEFAGYRSKNRGTIGIGRYAGAPGGSNIVLGNFPYSMMGGYIENTTTVYNLVSTSGVTVWDSKLPNPSKALLYAGAGAGQTSDLILAAKNIYSYDGTIKRVTSDVRSKRKISLAPYGIKDFRKFNIYNFTLKSDKEHEKHIGVIAQEYRKAFPLGLDKNGKYYSVKLDWLYYSMINAVKDLDKLIQEFQVKFDEYINNFESIKARIDVLEKAVAQEKINNENMRKELEQVNAKLNAKK